jgi:prolyl-tRNA synthetase
MGIADGVTGANRSDTHMMGVAPGRDFTASRVEDIRTAVEGDPCPRCRRALRLFGGIEVGHIFQLGTKYSAELGATFLDADGKERPCVMGCYGIGVNRIAAARIDSTCDESGIVWSPSIAPYEVVVMPLDMSEPELVSAAEEAYEALLDGGFDVIIDDRDERPGVKFKDADLIGFPLRVVVGKGYLRTGKLELQVRRDGSKSEVETASLAASVGEALAGLSKPVQPAAST